MWRGKRKADRSAKEKEEAKHHHTDGQASEETAGQRVRKLREIEATQVITDVGCRATDDEGCEIERLRAEPP